jgi:hypothetical protein
MCPVTIRRRAGRRPPGRAARRLPASNGGAFLPGGSRLSPLPVPMPRCPYSPAARPAGRRLRRAPISRLRRAPRTRTPSRVRLRGRRSRSPPTGPPSPRGTADGPDDPAGRAVQHHQVDARSLRCGRCTPSASHPATSPGSGGAAGGNASGSAPAARSPRTGPASLTPYSRRSSRAGWMTGGGRAQGCPPYRWPAGSADHAGPAVWRPAPAGELHPDRGLRRGSRQRSARRLFPVRQGRHPAALNFGDCCVYAVASVAGGRCCAPETTSPAPICSWSASIPMSCPLPRNNRRAWALSHRLVTDLW